MKRKQLSSDRISTARKIRLLPTEKQAEKLRQHAGVARAIYNAGIVRQQQHLDMLNRADRHVVDKNTGELRSMFLYEKLLSSYDLQKELNEGKKEEPQIVWVKEVSKCVGEGALDALGAALERWYKPDASGKRAGFPKFKSMKDGLGSFVLRNTNTQGISLLEDRLLLPILGEIKIGRVSRWPISRVTKVRISEDRGKWWVSCSFDIPRPVPTTNAVVVGVDVGIKTLATLSTGETFENPKFLQHAAKRLRRQQRTVSRRYQKGRVQSKNYEKARTRLSKTHERVVNLRRNAIHKVTSAIVKQAGTVVVESLNVNGMLKNHRLARALSDAAFGEMLRQISYKTERWGVRHLKVEKFWPSSKRCYKCGTVKDKLPLSTRVFCCDAPGCGWLCDRDLNAALNLSIAPGIPGAVARPKETDVKGGVVIPRPKPVKSGTPGDTKVSLRHPRRSLKGESSRQSTVAHA